MQYEVSSLHTSATIEAATAEQAAIDFMRDHAGEVGDWVLGVTREPGKSTAEIVVLEPGDEAGETVTFFWAKAPCV